MTNNKEFINSLNGLEYAKLTEHQKEELKNLEQAFNNNNNTSFYFMVFDKG